MEHIKELRDEKGMSQKELAEMLDIHRTAVAKYEAGANGAKTEILERLANIFDVSTDYLLGRTDTRRTERGGETLDAEEREILTLFRELNAEGRLAAFGMITGLVAMRQYKKAPVSGKIQEIG